MREKLAVWLAWHMPRPLVYWCAIRLMSWATVDKYGDTDPNELKVMTALERWG